MNFFSRLGLSTPPFDHSVRAVIVGSPSISSSIARTLRAAKAETKVVADLHGVNGSIPDIFLLDLQCAGAWDFLKKSRPAPVIALVEGEAIGMKALMHGADGVLNLNTMKAPEIIGLINRITSRATNSHWIQDTRERVIQAANNYLADCHS